MLFREAAMEGRGNKQMGTNELRGKCSEPYV